MTSKIYKYSEVRVEHWSLIIYRCFLSLSQKGKLSATYLLNEERDQTKAACYWKGGSFEHSRPDKNNRYTTAPTKNQKKAEVEKAFAHLYLFTLWARLCIVSCRIPDVQYALSRRPASSASRNAAPAKGRYSAGGFAAQSP